MGLDCSPAFTILRDCLGRETELGVLPLMVEGGCSQVTNMQGLGFGDHDIEF